MEVHLAPGQPPRLTEPTDLRRFSVIVAATPEALPTLAEALHGIVDFDGTEHAWVSVDWLIGASDRGDWADWRYEFDNMVKYATGKGWVREDPPALRGHIVWQSG